MRDVIFEPRLRLQRRTAAQASELKPVVASHCGVRALRIRLIADGAWVVRAPREEVPVDGDRNVPEMLLHRFGAVREVLRRRPWEEPHRPIEQPTIRKVLRL